MARPVREITNEDVRKYNDMRAKHQQESYTYNEIVEMFRKIHLPGEWNFIKELTWGEHPPLHKYKETIEGKEKIFYRFHDKPLYKERLKKAYDEYRTKSSAKVTVVLSKTTIKNTECMETPQQKPKEEEKSVIECAIELLKKEGYRIYKPKVEYEEI